MQIPGTVSITTPGETNFGAFDSAWLLVIIVGIILIWQIIKFFFEIAERYVILAVLTIMAPLAFWMGVKQKYRGQKPSGASDAAAGSPSPPF